MTPHGSIAIIRPEFNTEDECETSYTEVVKSDAGGQKVLDEQPCSVEDANDEPVPNPDAIRPHSLTYDGALVHWKDGSTDKLAPLT